MPSLHSSLAAGAWAGLVLALFWVAYNDAGTAPGAWLDRDRPLVGDPSPVRVPARRRAVAPARCVRRRRLACGIRALDASSMLWAPSVEEAFCGVQPQYPYSVPFCSCCSSAGALRFGRWCDALALAIVAISALALLSRLFPGALPDRGLAALPALGGDPAELSPGLLERSRGLRRVRRSLASSAGHRCAEHPCARGCGRVDPRARGDDLPHLLAWRSSHGSDWNCGLRRADSEALGRSCGARRRDGRCARRGQHSPASNAARERPAGRRACEPTGVDGRGPHRRLCAS